MKKGFYIFLAFILMVCGIYGTYYFITLKNAEVLINRSIADIDEGNYDEAISSLKNVLSKYKYSVIRAPSLFLLGNSWEHKKNYDAAIKAYNALVSDKKLDPDSNWYIRAIISISKIYRNNLVKSSVQQKENLQSYISLIEKIMREKKEKEADLKENIGNFINKILVFNFSIYKKDIDEDKIIDELETELGFLYLNTKNYDEAIKTFSKLKTNLARFGLAKAYIESQNTIKGLNTLEGLIEYDSTGNILSYYLKTAYDYAKDQYDRKKFSNSIPMFKRIISLSKNSGYTELSMYYIGEYYYKLKNYKMALNYIDKVLKNTVYIKDEEAQLLKGYIYYDRNDFIMSLKVFNDFIKRFHKSSKVRTAREWKELCERNIRYFG